MSRLYLVRHGEPSETVGIDPGLTEQGRLQAQQLVARLAGIGPVPIWTSPLRRALETAEPLANAWQQPARVLHAVRELPSPAGMPVAERGAWLRTALVGTIDSLGSAQIAWRDGIIEALSELSARSDAVIVSHFVVNNAVVAHANGDRRVCVFRPAHTSITIVDVERSDSGAATIRVVELGGERITSIR